MPPSKRGGITAYAAPVTFEKVRVRAPAMPEVIEDLKGVLRFQHSKAELLFESVTIAVRVK